MSAMILIENAPGSGQVIKVIESFGQTNARQDLLPGENVRIPLSQHKAVVILEAKASDADASFCAGPEGAYFDLPPRRPLKLY